MPVPLTFSVRAAEPRTNLRKIVALLVLRDAGALDPRRRCRRTRRCGVDRHAAPCDDSGEYLTALSSRFLSASASASRSARIAGAGCASPRTPVQLDAMRGRRRWSRNSSHDAAHQFGRVGVLHLIGAAAGLDAAEVEQALDHRVQPPALLRRAPGSSRGRRSGGVPPSSSISVRWHIAVSGVRNSCETAATKSDCSRATPSSRCHRAEHEVAGGRNHQHHQYQSRQRQMFRRDEDSAWPPQDPRARHGASTAVPFHARRVTRWLSAIGVPHDRRPDSSSSVSLTCNSFAIDLADAIRSST